MSERRIMGSSVAHEARLGALLEEHRDTLLRMIRNRLSPSLSRWVEPEDVLNEVYIKLHKTQSSRHDAPEPSFGLLYLAVRECLIDGYRRHSRQKRDIAKERPWPDHASEALGSQLAASLTTASEAFGRAEARDLVQTILRNLDPIDREVLELRHLDGMDYHRIAEALGMTRNAVMQRHSRLLKKIKDDHPGIQAGGGGSKT